MVWKRLSYANVVASLALFLALGGVGYAATQLPNNSVGTPQLKANAVTSGKVKNGTLLKPTSSRVSSPRGRRATRAQRVTRVLRVPRAIRASRGRSGRATRTPRCATRSRRRL